MKRLIVAMASVLALAAASRAAAPVARLHDDFPGLYMDFDNGTSDFNGYGYKDVWYDHQWDVADGVLTAVDPGSWAVLGTSMKDDHEVYTPLYTANEWIFSMIWANNVGSGREIVEVKAVDGGRIATFTGVGGVEGNTTFELWADERGSYVRVAAVDIPIGQTQKLTLANTFGSRLEFWIDDEEVARHSMGRERDHSFGRIEILGGSLSPPGDTFDEIIAGYPMPRCNPGDCDGDGDIDDDDLSLLLAHWGQDVTGDFDGGCSKGEFSGVPPIDDDDLSIMLWRRWPGPLAPEPATLGLLALGGVLLLRRKHGP